MPNKENHNETFAFNKHKSSNKHMDDYFKTLEL